MGITFNNVGFVYENGFQALDNINLTVKDSSNIAIVGQNGAGKTTLVKLINALLKPTDGDVIVDGMNTKEYTTAQIARNVGYVFQNPDDQIFNSDVISEIGFATKVLGFDASKSKRMIELAVNLTNTQNIIHENPYNLPLSIRKFVTIASVIAMDTNLIILDEPTAGQDYNGLKVLSNMIKELKNMGKSIITITHDMEFVVDNFNTVIIMANKKIIKQSEIADTFSDDEILELSKLKKPVALSLAQDLGIKNMHNRDMFIDYIISHTNSSKLV